MSKIAVGVLRGGPSHEYEVSLESGKTVLQNLPEKYRPVDIFISKDGEWHTDGIARKPEHILKGVDVVFNALHGQYGEDGKVQRVLESIGVPYTGSDTIASALSMHKEEAKKIFKQAGIRVAEHKRVTPQDNMELVVRDAFETMFLPLIVKPVAAGSSVGMTVVHSYSDLPEAIYYAFGYSGVVLVENYIRGKEATCTVIDNFRESNHYALLPIEIVRPESKVFFDYDAKYKDAYMGRTSGSFSYEDKRAIEEAAIRAHKALGLRHYSRSDFIITPKRDVYILETNSLPGLTSHSFVPKSLEAIGSNMSEFLEHVITLAHK